MRKNVIRVLLTSALVYGLAGSVNAQDADEKEVSVTALYAMMGASEKHCDLSEAEKEVVTEMKNILVVAAAIKYDLSTIYAEAALRIDEEKSLKRLEDLLKENPEKDLMAPICEFARSEIEEIE